MKLLIKQYLSSLRERDELDVVLPDVLSELGFTVISRPGRGTTQYGVDVAAVGSHPKTGIKTLYLLSIKSGDLTRDEWDTGKQALRPSLVEILEIYIPKHIPKRYSKLPIVVALCFGGDIRENVRERVDGFTDKHTEDGVLEFAEWNGDFIANMIFSGLLRENIFPKNLQSIFRKSVALVDEPEVCVSHFRHLLNELTESDPKNLVARLRITRQIYLAAWTVFVWCRDAGNLESAYRCSQLAALYVWELSHKHMDRRSRASKGLLEVTDKVIRLSRIVGSYYIKDHIEPYSDIQDGLAASVPSASSVDINLKLFEALGRVAIHGLWVLQTKAGTPSGVNDEYLAAMDAEIQKTLKIICDLINNNPVFNTPLRDDHAIEITLTSLFLLQCKAYDFLNTWIEQILLSSIFSHRANGKYPCCLREYSDLASHPKYSEGYQEESTIGSVLYPSLGVWLGILRNEEMFKHLAEFHQSDMSHSTWQFWLPDEITDDNIYTNTETHGTSLNGLITAEGLDFYLEQVRKEIVASSEFNNLSAITRGVWPLILMACHTHRLPVPPNFWTFVINPNDGNEEE